MYWAEFFTIAAAHLAAVASPGPDFAVVLKQSVRSGTRIGVWTSLGVGAAILLHVTYCLLGVALLLSQSPTLFTAVRYGAALYLFYLGVMILRDLRQQSDSQMEDKSPLENSPIKAFYIGFLTNGLNPKATLFFLALFTVVIDPSTPLTIQVAYGVYLAVATFCWFSMLSYLLGRPGFRLKLLELGPWFERLMAIILIGLALQIALL